MNNAVIYTRFSCNRQETGASIETQLEKCLLQAQLTDAVVVETIMDRGLSAKNLDREGIQTLINLVKTKQVNQVIIYRLDRLSRNVSDLNTLIQLFTKYGVALVSVSDVLNTETPSGRMVINVICSISQCERETLMSRVSDALQYRKRNNIRYSRIIPYGKELEGNNLVDNNQEQSVIEVMKSLHAKGESLRSIAKQLTFSNFPTRMGGDWSPLSVRKILIDQKSYKMAS